MTPLTDTLLALLLFTLLLGLTSSALALLIRVGSASLPELKRAWTWGAHGKPLNCPTCMGAWCALLTFCTLALLAYLFGFHDSRVLLLTALCVPGAGALSAFIQHGVIVEELVLPDGTDLEGPARPAPASVAEALLAAVEAGHPAADSRTCGDCTRPEHLEDGPSRQRYCRRLGAWLPVDQPCVKGKLAAR